MGSVMKFLTMKHVFVPIIYLPASDYFSDDKNMLIVAKAISEGLKKSAKKLYKVEK